MNESVEDVCYPLQDIEEIYQSMKGRRSLEIIFISADRDVGSFQE